jgi:translation elongation factor EF-4
MEYLDEQRVLLTYQMPLAELIVDFYDQLKTRTQGYASLDYHYADYRPADLVKLDVMVNAQPVDALSTIVHRDRAYLHGRALVEKLRELIPRQMFEVPRHAQERAGQVLRRRRDAEAEAARETSGRKEAYEAPRPGGDPPGGLHGRTLPA